MAEIAGTLNIVCRHILTSIKISVSVASVLTACGSDSNVHCIWMRIAISMTAIVSLCGLQSQYERRISTLDVHGGRQHTQHSVTNVYEGSPADHDERDWVLSYGMGKT